MPSPKSEWEFLQDILMQNNSYNGAVKRHFRDVNDDDDPLTMPRAAVRSACLIKDVDSALIAMHRRLFFYFEVLETHNKPEVYQTIDGDKMVRRGNQPKISLYFKQDRDEIEAGKQAESGLISFRIMNQTSQQITKTEAEQWGNKIKQLFMQSGGYRWQKGKNSYSYCEWHRGYQFQILAPNESEAKELITKCMDIQNHTPNWSYLNKIVNEEPLEAYPNIPDKVSILGVLTPEPQFRPVCYVRFAYATLYLPPAKPQTLIDRTGRRRSALID